MTAEDIQFIDALEQGVVVLPMQSEAASAGRSADHPYEGDYLLPGNVFFGQEGLREKEFEAAACANVLKGKSPQGAGKRHSSKAKAREGGRLAALQVAKQYVSDGYGWTIKLCLDVRTSIQSERFKSRLAQMYYDATGDKGATSLLSKSLNRLSNEYGGCEHRLNDAVLQAALPGWIGQLVRNALLAELEKRGHRVVAIDDGVVVFLGSKAAAQRVGASMQRFADSALCAYLDGVALQAKAYSDESLFGLAISLEQGELRVGVHRSALQRIKDDLRRVTGRSRGVAMAVRLREIAQIVKAYGSLLALADDAHDAICELNEWMAARFRMVLWKQWKLVRTRISRLEALGVPHAQAKKLGGTHLGYWAAANSDGLKQALPYSKLRRMGFTFFLMEPTR